MIDITVYKQSNYPVSANKIRNAVTKVLEDNGIVSDSDISVAIMGEKKMKDLGYEGHPVLSYPTSDIQENFIFPPDGKLYLGEIIISFTYAVKEANETGRLLDEIVVDWAKHGALHLIGIHHE